MKPFRDYVMESRKSADETVPLSAVTTVFDDGETGGSMENSKNQLEIASKLVRTVL